MLGSGQSIEFAQFLPELAEAVIPLCVSVHFFSAPVSEQSGRAFQPFGLLVKKDAHLGGYLLHPMVVHSRRMRLLRGWRLFNCEHQRGGHTTEVPKREVPTMIVFGTATSVAKRRRQTNGTSSHHDWVAKRLCGLFRTPNRPLSCRTLTIRAARLQYLALQCV
jgi:hypothetical protein